MSAVAPAKAVSKKIKKRRSSNGKENRESEMIQVSPSNSVSSTASTTRLDKLSKEGNTLNDPAIVAAGQPRRQPLSKKSSIINKESSFVAEAAGKVDGNNKLKATRVIKPTAPGDRSPRSTKKSSGRASHYQQGSKISSKTSADMDDSIVSAPRAATPRKERSKFPTAATPPRSQSDKSKRGSNQVERANESMESETSLPDEKARSVRFQTESPPLTNMHNVKQASAKINEVKGLSPEALAQQAAFHDAATLLAQSTMPSLPNFANPLYANLLSTNLAQQQLATAQVLANLRASVGGFKPMKNFEPASAYDASRVPCLADREDINTTTNIYVNNLPTHTTDDDLLRLGACFGPVKSHKAIINQETGLCKGYGFIMYEHALDAETALQQLPLHGLTTSWAKESFSTKLRKLSDNQSTNVYVSNLPMDMTPHQLEQLFTPHVVVSLRILLDDNGDSRGVGFVRLRDRDTAQECIDKLHGKILLNQSTPLQARFADSEAQKRLKQTVHQAAPSLANTKSTVNSKNPIGLCDANSLADSMFLASLQGVHNWTGFGTPQSNAAAAFPVTSPSLGMASPGLNYTQWSPSMAANAAANWNLLNSDIYGNPLLSANSANYGLQYGSLFSPSSLTSSMTSPLSPYAHLSNKSLSPLSFASTPLSSNSPMMGKNDQGSRNGAVRNKATYLPPDVHQQHAKALLEAQGNFAFDSPQAEAFGLSQLLLNSNNVMTNEQSQQLSSNEHYPFSSAHSYVNTPQAKQVQIQLANNALGVSNMAHKGDSHSIKPTLAKQTSATIASQLTKDAANFISFPSVVVPPTPTIDPSGKNQAAINSTVEFSLSKIPEKTVAGEALDQDNSAMETAKMPDRVSTPMPGSIGDKGSAANGGAVQVQDSVTEEGDSLVIDSGSATAVGKFSSQRSEALPLATLSKSDSAKSLSPKKQQEGDQVAIVIKEQEAIQSSLPVKEQEVVEE